jgi:hypothetical protein
MTKRQRQMVIHFNVYPCPEALPDGEVIRGATLSE